VLSPPRFDILCMTSCSGTKSSPRPASSQHREVAHALTGRVLPSDNNGSALTSIDDLIGMPSPHEADSCTAPCHTHSHERIPAPLPKSPSAHCLEDPTLAVDHAVPAGPCTAATPQPEQAQRSAPGGLGVRREGPHGTKLPCDTSVGGRPATRHAATTTTGTEPTPYVLTAVGHSLGGAQLLMYTVMQLRRREKHRLSRLVLLTPAGFVKKVPFLLAPISWCLPALTWMARRLFRDGLCVPFMIPTNWARSLFWDLGADLKSVPALGKLIRCACSSFRVLVGTGCTQSVGASVVQVHTQ
jgi:hypothetical protein